MAQPFFTTNENEIGLLEEVVVKERSVPGPVAGVVADFVSAFGQSVRGPANTPVFCGGEGRALEVFGGRDQGDGGNIANDFYKMRLNKPFSGIWFTRAVAADAYAASKTFDGYLTVAASSPGAWGTKLTVSIQTATDADATHFNLVATYLGQTQTFKNLNISGANNNLLQVTGSDPALFVTLTKAGSGRPTNVTGASLTTVAGTDGTLNDAAYLAALTPATSQSLTPGSRVVVCAEHMSAAIKAAMIAAAPNATDRVFLVSANDETVTNSAAITEAGTLTRLDRCFYAFNHAYTLDPATASEVITNPTSWMACDIINNAVDEDIGREESKAFNAGITRLYNPSLVRSDYIALRQAGISALEHDGGYDFESAVTTDLTPGKERMARRFSTDYLQNSLANALKHFVKQKYTDTRKAEMAGQINDFLRSLQKRQFIVQAFSVDSDSLNTDSQLTQGIVRILMRVKLIGHILTLVLEDEVGYGLTIQEAA